DFCGSQVTGMSCVGLFDGVKCGPRPVWRNRRQTAIRTFFLGRAIKIDDVNSVSAFESDATVAGKCCDGGDDQDQSEDDDFFHGIARVRKKVAASATQRTTR